MSAAAHDPVRWFAEHFDQAADEILPSWAATVSRSRASAWPTWAVATGSSISAWPSRGSPEELVGYDLMESTPTALLRAARAAGVRTSCRPACASSARSPSHPRRVGQLRHRHTWSVFEHVDDPVGLLGEVSRVLKPDGYLFLQLWPFYDSEHGGHLWPHYEGPYPHHLSSDEEILDRGRGRARHRPAPDRGGRVPLAQPDRDWTTCTARCWPTARGGQAEAPHRAQCTSRAS